MLRYSSTTWGDCWEIQWIMVHFHWSYHQVVKYHTKSIWLMNQSSLSTDCLSVQKCSALNFLKKYKWYTTAGWWVPAAVKQGTPMLCMPKKNGTLCTIFNLWQQNKNTWKDVTPFPDQDMIHHDVVQAKFRSKPDMTEAYEQTCIRPEDICKMTFSTIFGTFQSQVMQMGDCNAPSTFQQLMAAIFWEFLRRFVHVYLDDIFTYSQSIREHIEHIMKVLQQLKELHIYLSKSKLDLFSDKTDCLGHVIDDNGINAKLDKMWQIRKLRIPRNYNEVQKFLGLVQYLALYMPYIMTYTTPLSGLAQNNQIPVDTSTG